MKILPAGCPEGLPNGQCCQMRQQGCVDEIAGIMDTCLKDQLQEEALGIIVSMEPRPPQPGEF